METIVSFFAQLMRDTDKHKLNVIFDTQTHVAEIDLQNRESTVVIILTTATGLKFLLRFQ